MLNDLRYALRQLRKSPGFTFVAVLTLALGIGANTAIFSVVDAVLLRPLGYEKPEQLVSIWSTNPKDEIKQEAASFPDFNDWRQQARSFAGMAGFATFSPILGGTEGEPERIQAGHSVGDLFSVLGVQPILGRRFLEEENKEGGNRVVILSYGLWQRRFAGDSRVIGQQVLINGTPCAVVGVLPRDFENPMRTEAGPVQLWTPLEVTAQKPEARRQDFLCVIGRLKANSSLQQASAEMTAIARQLETQYPNSNIGWSTIVEPLHETLTGDMRRPLLVLLGGVSFLLLIACANVANLLLARASARQREIAIRVALGASRARIVRQLLTENVLLSLTGGALGLVLAFWGLHALVALGPADIPRLDSIRIDRAVFCFTLLLSLGTGVIFGLAPALTVSNPHLNDTLKEGGRSSAEGSGGRRVRSALAISEIALSLVLLVGASLLARSFLRLQHVDPGFRPDHVLTVRLSLPKTKYKGDEQLSAFYEQLLSRVVQQSGVESAAVTNNLPIGEVNDLPQLYFRIYGRVRVPTAQLPDAEARVVSPDYFRALQIPLRRGRLFDSHDAKGAPEVAVISETLARRYFPNEDPIGKRITLHTVLEKWSTIVGVVGDVKGGALTAEPYPQIYGSYLQSPSRSMTLVVRTTGDPLAISGSLGGQVRALDSEQPLYNVRSLEQVLSSSIARPRFNMLLITILAGVALLLAAIGIYGVISYSVVQRTHEIGVRIALGATYGDVIRLVVRQGIFLAAAGLGIGSLTAIAVTRAMATLLYGISATDPATFLGVAIVLGGIAFVASYIPARRATKVDPMIALRHE
jgi:putative ABC transport system permease protein